MRLFVNQYRDTWCEAVGEALLGREVRLAGWVEVIRDHGGVLFFHLRDETETVQVVLDPSIAPEVHRLGEQVGRESVIAVTGQIRRRPEGAELTHLRIKEHEVLVSALVVLNDAEPLPFSPEDAEQVHEDARLAYRYIELRNRAAMGRLKSRHRFLLAVRHEMDVLGFCEYETPVLTKSTPEGARDYLVPSRLHKGSFYALPQSPQLFKQLLMVAGAGRYFQIARCFRDEDLRANRQPEFTQIDLEASFVTQEDILQVVEEVLCAAAAELGVRLARPFQRLSHERAMHEYGTDSPDLRYPFELCDLSEVFRGSELSIFRRIAEKNGLVYGIRIGNHEFFTKGAIERLRDEIMAEGAAGMAWGHRRGSEFVSPIAKHLASELQGELLRRMDLTEEGDLMVFMADPSPDKARALAGKLRTLIAERLGMVRPDEFRPLWVLDFPLFELDATRRKVTSNHHPFTAPLTPEGLDAKDPRELLKLRAQCFDLVLNGQEIGSGSIRIHDDKLQRRVFELLGMGPEEIDARFGFFLRALSHGAPPHGGIALGVDRLMQILTGAASIREVIAFPKNKRGLCPLTDAPSEVEVTQLVDLGVRVVRK